MDAVVRLGKCLETSQAAVAWRLSIMPQKKHLASQAGRLPEKQNMDMPGAAVAVSIRASLYLLPPTPWHVTAHGSMAAGIM